MAKKALPLALGAGAVALAVSSGKKKKGKKKGSYYGVIASSCKKIKVTDTGRFYDWVRGASKELFEAQPDTTPFEALPMMMEEISGGKCPTFPEDPGSANALLLSDSMLRTAYGVYRSLPENTQQVPSEVMDQAKDYVAWFARYEIKYAKKLWADTAPDMVAFLPDYSKYYIGPEFFKMRVAPYVKGVMSEGGTKDDVFDTFVQNQEVAVGVGSVVTIADLPQNKPAVQEFLTTLASKIQEM